MGLTNFPSMVQCKILRLLFIFSLVLLKAKAEANDLLLPCHLSYVFEPLGDILKARNQANEIAKRDDILLL